MAGKRRYKVWEDGNLIMSNATARMVSEEIGISKNVVYKYATDEYSNGYYKKRYFIRYDEETDQGGKPIDIPHKAFVQRFGMKNLQDWEDMQKAVYLLQHQAKTEPRMVLRFYFVPRKTKDEKTNKDYGGRT